MQNKDNQRFYPLRDSENPFKVTLTPITEEQYRSLYPDIWSTQKREQYHRRCMCPKYYLWKCDGQCDLCEYHVPDIVSLDEPLPDGNGTLGDYIPDSSGNKGIACGLNNLQKIRDGEPLGGKASAESDFATDDDEDFLD